MIRLYMAAAMVLVMAIAAYLHESAQGETVQPSEPSPYDKRLIELDRAAADEAYQHQIASLIAVWLKDDTGQPARATVGANRARRAYIAVMREIEQREKRP